MMKILQSARALVGVFVVWMGVESTNTVHSLSEPHTPAITFLSSYALPALQIDGLTISELSDLAWDEDEQLLYAVSDRGQVFHFQLSIEHDAITALTPVYGAGLLNAKGKKLDWRDSEGLDVASARNGVRGDSELIIALEGLPRIGRFQPSGRLIEEFVLPKMLQNRRQYRASNTSLESVTLHPRYHYLTAPEQSLKNQPETQHTLYSPNETWRFPAYAAKKSAITALQTLPNGNVLILERAWSGVMNPLVISLRYLDFQRCSKQGECEVQDLAVLSSLFLVDNFEGLTHFRDDLYLMVSDDGHSQFQRTLLTLFRLELPAP